MSDPSLAFQDAVIAALRAAAGVTAIVAQRVYDVPPTDPMFPYVSLGPVQVLPDKAGCIDGAEVFQQIDGWSRKLGSVQAKQIGAAVKAVLDDTTPTVTGFTCVILEHEDTNYVEDPDGLTHHAIIRFHALIEPQ